MTKRKNKRRPFDPAKAERERADQERRAEEIKARRADRRERESRGLTVNVDPKTQEILSTTRRDCFDTLLPDRSPVDWLETLIRTANGENGQERRPDFIRAPGFNPGPSPSDEMLIAHDQLEAVAENLFPACARLLFGLLRPDAALRDNWRSVVHAATGEKNEMAQGAVVRAAVANLQWVRDNVDRLTRERRERRMAA